MLIPETHNGITILKYQGFGDSRVIYGFSTKEGGVSKPPFSSLNLAYHVGDEPVNVNINRELFFSALGLDLDRSTWAEQVHGNHLVVLSQSDAGKGARNPYLAIPSTDAIVTNIRGSSVAIMTADCVALLIYDPVNGVVAAAHAGWRGTLAKVPIVTIEAMQRVFGTDPLDCQVAVGPGIGPCCFQVGFEVVDGFDRAFGPEMRACMGTDGDRWYIDLPQVNSVILQGIGVLGKNIFVSPSCTCCNGQHYYSYRREQGRTGRMAAVIGLVE